MLLPQPSPSAVTITSPADDENIVLFFTAEPIYLTAVSGLVRGTNPGISFSLRFGTEAGFAGTEVVTGGIALDPQHSGRHLTALDHAEVPENSFVWLTTSNRSGSVDELNVTLHY